MDFLLSLLLADPAQSVRLIWWARDYLEWLWRSRLRPSFTVICSAR